MNNKSLVTVIAVVAVAVIGFLFYRQNDLENRLVLQQQQLATKEKEAASLREAQQRVFDRIEAKDRARIDLQNEPSKFIKGGNWDVVRRGLFSTLSLATAVEFTNNSQFDVSDISGKLTYMNETGAEIATVPFTADGDIGTGRTKKLKITATEITGNAQRGRVLVERVRIVGGL